MVADCWLLPDLEQVGPTGFTGLRHGWGRNCSQNNQPFGIRSLLLQMGAVESHVKHLQVLEAMLEVTLNAVHGLDNMVDHCCDRLINDQQHGWWHWLGYWHHHNYH